MLRTTLLIIPMASMLLACGLFTGVDEPTGATSTQTVLPVLFHGDTSVEEKVLRHEVIVKATMTSLSSEVIVRANNNYSAVLKFNLSVSEYLKGTGPSNITAVWIDGRSYGTSSEANDAKTIILAERDTQWDDREAVIFLSGRNSGYGTALDRLLRRTDHFLLGFGDKYSPNDYYSLHSTEYKAWLPAVASCASSTSSEGDNKGFLLDVPAPTVGASASSTTPTITLTNLKKHIKTLTTELNSGNGSAAYRECVREKYGFERRQRYVKALDGSDLRYPSVEATSLASGQPANTVLHTGKNYGNYPSQKARTWFEGADAALFTVAQGNPTPQDLDGDGKYTAGVDGIEFTEAFKTVRPLPAGVYKANRKEVWVKFLPCNYTITYNWTITVTAPPATLHEAFFDPVTVGAAVKADAESGVLTPRTFTGASGAPAAIQRIAYEAGAVTIAVTPVDALAGHVVDVIAMDGAVTLSLAVADAAADAGGGTLRWPASTAPWASGDTLMLRIRPAPAATGQAVTGRSP